MFDAVSASFARRASFRRRQGRALVAIALWLWSCWVIAAGCCCEPVQSSAADVAPHPDSVSSADEHGRHHGHPVADDVHPHETLPVDDCPEIKAPIHGFVPKEAAPPPTLAFDHLSVVPAQVAPLPSVSGDARHDWSLPPPSTRLGNPFLQTVRLLL